uniref:inositol-polyphosphate 5-phosphatase n=1 Tax=Esox lucius TaxID=8010 RepID=A0AAY5KXK8_ESOLU
FKNDGSHCTVRIHKPRFVALHFQEVGGKDYMDNMGHAENFFWNIESSEEMRDFDRVCVYVDNHFKNVDSFTALGSMYFIHKSLKNIYQYDFNDKWGRHGCYFLVVRVDCVGCLLIVHCNICPSLRACLCDFCRGLDLINVHLFHDASNLIACNASPSIYSANRQKALRYVINRITDSSYTPLPFFLFGDFNFRLDTLSLVQNLSTSAEVQTVMKDCSNDVEKIICEEKDNEHKVLLHIETKMFAYLHQAVFREDNGRALLKYDKEITAFHDVITEEEILFPPSYPYSEDYTKPTQYMNTRCPSWCDRILMSHTAKDVIHRSNDGESRVVYNALGPNVCMGDHKVQPFLDNAIFSSMKMYVLTTVA